MRTKIGVDYLERGGKKTMNGKKTGINPVSNGLKGLKQYRLMKKTEVNKTNMQNFN